MVRCGLVLLLVTACLAAAGAGIAQTPAGGLEGQVVAPDGTPLAGARVRLYYRHDTTGYGCRWLSETRADATGRFVLRVPPTNRPAVMLQPYPPRMYLVAEAEGFARAIAEAWPQRRTGYRLRCASAREVEVTFQNTQGTPVAGASVTAMYWLQTPTGTLLTREAYTLAPLLKALWSATTDEKGRARLTNLPPWAVRVRAFHPAHGMGHGNAMPDARRVAVRVNVRGRRVEGDVTTPDGRPPAQCLVAYSPGIWTSWDLCWSLADAKGHFLLWVPALLGGRAGRLRRPALLLMDPSPQPRFAAASLVLPGAQVPNPLKVVVSPGGLVRGVAVRAGDGEPIADLLVAAYSQRGGGRRASQYRLTDERGRFTFCLSGPDVIIRAQQPPSGYVFSERGRWQRVHLEGKPLDVTLSVPLVPAVVLSVQARDARGRPLKGCMVVPTQPGNLAGGVRTDDEGRAFLTDLAAGKPLRLCVLSSDRSLGAFYATDALAPPPDGTLALVLKTTLTGEVHLRVPQGAGAARAFVGLYLSVAGGRQRVPVASARAEPDGKPVRIPGLLPGVDYQVYAYARGFERVFVPWRIPPGTAKPRLEIALQRQVARAPRARRRPGADTRPRTEADFQRELEGLKGALWKKPDPVEKHLTWYALKSGLALADAREKRVRFFQGLFGYDHISVRAVAFGPAKVWVATDRGLMAYDRKSRSWTRYAVGGLYVDRPVASVEWTRRNTLKVVLSKADGPAQTYEYDPRANTWRRLP